MPFKKLLYCNIGNPLSLGQPTFSFDREVLACCLSPSLLTSPSVSEDAKERAKTLLKSVDYPHGLGAYTASAGLKVVRESIKRFIEERDGYPCDINNLFLGNGASDAVQTIFNVLITDPKDGVLNPLHLFQILIPIPQYPLYSALISLLDGTPVPYYLNESKGWALDVNRVLIE